MSFHRNWNAYKVGFGDPREQFWIGNDALYALTNQGDYSMQIDMLSCDGNAYYVRWNLFRIQDESQKYKVAAISVDSYNTSSNSYLTENVNWKFGTYDNDEGHSRNCSDDHGGGWWYTDCTRWHLTGYYPSCAGNSNNHRTMKFASITGNNCNNGCLLQAATLKIQRNT
ncbi:fibrinogen-like protein A [Lingula anatina]|uniref:Fibrinogen-like protein A n=1 Tax=Lingula anatina TaxID=7574 RepID=A0A1S3J5N0_LINAN|nr:fibrinogen-like protein A [Lingula anatina]|eukprot:XP_013405561.1 fibrinogen-like protein A [Lingula anatina]